MRKQGQVSKTTEYRRKQEAAALGCPVASLPDMRGKQPHLRAEKHYRWSRHKMLSPDGYVKIRVGCSHPLADPNGYCYEHKLVWIAAGRQIPDGWLIHHLNGHRQDNRIENLECVARGFHNHVHNQERGRTILGQFKART